MVYTVTSTERTNQSATEHETKAMLYLMNFHKDSDDVYFFAIDFFNDVTGIHSMGNKAWDIQSKSSKNINPRKAGEFLVTLYKNYLCEFNFNHFILFVGGIAQSSLEHPNLTLFDIANFKERARKSVFEGLKEACSEKEYIREYINNKLVTDDSINDFLSKVTFVTDNKQKGDYIKHIIKVKSSLVVNDDYLGNIFDQIRDAQSCKKNINVENVTINVMRDFERFNKHLTVNEIKLLVLSRLLHRENIKEAVISPSFLPVMEGRNKEFLLNCIDDISRVLFDNNNAKAYWELFEEIHTQVLRNPDLGVKELIDIIDEKKFNKLPHLNFNSAMYFISLVKDGIAV